LIPTIIVSCWHETLAGPSARPQWISETGNLYVARAKIRY